MTVLDEAKYQRVLITINTMPNTILQSTAVTGRPMSSYCCHDQGHDSDNTFHDSPGIA